MASGTAAASAAGNTEGAAMFDATGWRRVARPAIAGWAQAAAPVAAPDTGEIERLTAELATAPNPCIAGKATPAGPGSV